MTEDDDTTWPMNPFEAFEQASETTERAAEQQRRLWQSMLDGGSNGLGAQLGAMSRMATFKTRVQSGGRLSIPDAERETLDIEEGDIVQTIVVPVKRNRDE